MATASVPQGRAALLEQAHELLQGALERYGTDECYQASHDKLDSIASRMTEDELWAILDPSVYAMPYGYTPDHRRDGWSIEKPNLFE